MTAAFFIAGTDTEVGKTYIASTLLRAAASQGLTTLAVKPVAAGCEETPEGRRNEDALQLQAAMTEDLPYELVNPVVLQEPLSPHLAARHEGVEISVQELAAHCRRMMERSVDLVLIEGAGGWRVPLNAREDMSDLAKELGLPVILVVDMKLGCLNHALLTVEAIERDGLSLAGWIANQSQPQPMATRTENLQTLMQRLSAPCLGQVDYQDSRPVIDWALLRRAGLGLAGK